MIDKRTLRVFCPTHEAAFETAKSPKILCEITEHALSVGFPNSEFWEFCCNCETFTPSRLDKGEKARKTCYGCGNEISKHFACADCKTFSFESEAQTKGKRYFIDEKGIQPSCPGCESNVRNGAMNWHECAEINAGFFTAREACPFCLKNVSAKPAPRQNKRRAETEVICPQCGFESPPNAGFCGNCRYKLRKDAAPVKAGTEVNKTKLLGSLCPNCSLPLPSDASFCGECGQAVKYSPPPPPPKRNNPSKSKSKPASFDTDVLDPEYSRRARWMQETEAAPNFAGRNTLTAYQTSNLTEMSSTSSRKLVKGGLPEYILSALPYLPFCFGLIISIAQLFTVPRQETKVRFHAAQGFVVQLFVLAVIIILANVSFALYTIFSFVYIIALIFWTVKALQKKPPHLRFLDSATEWVERKFSPRD